MNLINDMLKKTKLWIALALAVVAMAFSSCDNLFSMEYKIVGIWQVSHTYLNGESIDSTNYLGFSPGTYYYIYADHMMMVISMYNGVARESVSSYYILDEKNKTVEINFSLYGRKYHFIADVDRLTKKDFFIEFDDEKGNHWRLEMFSRSN